MAFSSDSNGLKQPLGRKFEKGSIPIYEVGHTGMSFENSISRPQAGALVHPDWGMEKGGGEFCAERIVARLRPNLSRGFSRELESLRGEKDPELFFEGLLTLGRRQILADQIEGGLRTFQIIQESLGEDFPDISARVQLELDAILGRGSSGRRVEFLGRTFAGQATDPVLLASLGLGALAFNAVRTGTLVRLLGSPGKSILSSGIGARAVAGGLGFAAENLAFVYSGRLLRQWGGTPLDWSGEAQARELGSSALLLGGLRIAGGTSSRLTERFGLRGSLAPAALRQAGMFSGIMLGHHLEKIAGLRPEVDRATTLADSLAMLLQFNVAGRLSEAVLGRGWAAFQRDLQLRSESLTRERAWPLTSLFVPEIAGPPNLRPASPKGRGVPSHVLFAENKGDGPAGKGPKGPRDTDPGMRDTVDSGSLPPREPGSPPRLRGETSIQIARLTKGRRIGPENRYEIVRQLGEGGLGVVYQAADRKTGRFVAVKIPKGRNTAEDLARFEKEIWISENLASGWAVTIYDHFELKPGSGVQVPVMEYVEGTNLSKLLIDLDLERENIERRFPLERRIDFFADLCLGIHDAHQHGITHNDLKPENIMVNRHHRARILDWGMARHVGDPLASGRGRMPPEALLAMPKHRTHTGDLMGTPGYIAPEVGTNQMHLNERSRDIFALGVMLYEISTGKQPFAKYQDNPSLEGPRKIPLRVLATQIDEKGAVVQVPMIEIDQRKNIFFGTGNHSLPKFREVLAGNYPSYLNELEAIAFRAMDPDPLRRYQNAGELREAVLMARPRAMYRELTGLKESIRREYEKLNQVWLEHRDGLDLPPHAGGLLHGPIEQLRQRNRAWEQGVIRLLNRLAGITGERGGEERSWDEAHRMMAEVNWQILNEQMDYLPREVREDLVEQIVFHDRDLSGKNKPTLSLSLTEAIPLKFQVLDFETGKDFSAQVSAEVVPWGRERTAEGRETGNFREGTAYYRVQDLTSDHSLELPIGYYALKLNLEGYAETVIPLRITLEAVRAYLEGGGPGLTRTIRLIPQTQVAPGLRVVNEGEATIGLNIFRHENLMTAYGFPAKSRRIPTLAISRDPVTVGEYKEMVEEVLRTGGPEEAEKLIPRVLRSAPVWIRDKGAKGEGALAWFQNIFRRARGVLARVGRSLLPSGGVPPDKGYQLIWKIQDNGRLSLGPRYELVDPSTHLDPNGDPIYLDQPVSFITYPMAQSYVRWRSIKDGVKYRLPEIDELEAISRNFFPWNFPWGYIFDPTFTVSRQIFSDKTLTYPQRIGTHPLGLGFDRDYTVFGTRGHLGNVRELSQTQGEEGTIAVFGGSVAVVTGPFYYPSSRNIWPTNVPLAAGGAIRLVQEFDLEGKDPEKK